MGKTSIHDMVSQSGGTGIVIAPAQKEVDAFVEAVRAGDAAPIMALLRENSLALINAADEYAETALMAAVKQGDTDTAALLLNMGADINQKNQYGDTALMTAAGFGPVEAVRFLLEAGASIQERNIRGLSAIGCARACFHHDNTALLCAWIEKLKREQTEQKNNTRMERLKQRRPASSPFARKER